MVLGPDGMNLFTINHGAGTVSVVDVRQLRVVGRPVVGEGPSYIIALGASGNH